jgi:hypothetical protein
VLGEDAGGEASVETAAVDGRGDVEAGADFALGGAVGCLGEVMQASFAGVEEGACWGETELGVGEVEGEEGGGDGGD